MPAANEAIADWLELIRGEYMENPGLCLTRQQVQRLWGLDHHVCDDVLQALVSEGFLRQTDNCLYAAANRKTD